MNAALTVFRIKTAVNYWINAKDEHALHSPFVYDLYTHLIKPHKDFYDFEVLRQMRRELLSNHTPLADGDEAGAGHFAGKAETVARLVRKCSKSEKTANLLYKLSERFGRHTLLELGTSVGITAAYMSRACPKAQFYTLEGNTARVREAEKTLNAYANPNTKIIPGNIDQTLPQLLEKLDLLDVVFFDANHRYEPTLRYYDLCKAKAGNDSVFILDDIRWSPEMKAVWDEICSREEITASIDLGEIGLLFFRKEQPKQHFVLKF